MTKFVYNNAQNASNSYTPFVLNIHYHSCVFFEKDTNTCSYLKKADKLAAELLVLLAVCHKNVNYAQKL